MHPQAFISLQAASNEFLSVRAINKNVQSHKLNIEDRTIAHIE